MLIGEALLIIKYLVYSYPAAIAQWLEDLPTSHKVVRSIPARALLFSHFSKAEILKKKALENVRSSMNTKRYNKTVKYI